MKVKWYKSGLFCLLMSFVVLTIRANETPSAQQNPTEMKCDVSCSGNQTQFKDCTCGCEEGFEKDDQEIDCVEKVCDPACEGEGVKCEGNECICKTEYSNVNGKPGTPNCVLTTTTESTEQTLATKPALFTENNTPTPVCDPPCEGKGVTTTTESTEQTLATIPALSTENNTPTPVCDPPCEGKGVTTTTESTEQTLATKPVLLTDNNIPTPPCDPPCEGKGVKCEENECVCEEEYSNMNEKPGTPNCVLTTTTESTEQTLATKSSLPTGNNISTPILTTNSTNVPLPHTPTIHLNITITKPEEQKYVMGEWTITGIIVLVACLVGALVYVCYKNRHRGSLRVATSTTL